MSVRIVMLLLLPGCIFIDADARAQRSAALAALDSTETGLADTADTTDTSETGETNETADTADTDLFPTVDIPAGTWTLGSPGTEPGHLADEPLREVTLTHGLRVATTEVTVSVWQTYAGVVLAPASTGCADCSMEAITWHEAAFFTTLLSAAEGLDACYTCAGTIGGKDETAARCAPTESPYECEGWRLLTEAEWEVAARAGSTAAIPSSGVGGDVTEGSLDDCADPVSLTDGTLLTDLAWYCHNAAATHPVAQLAPNAWGLYDTSGNVEEWCHDGYVDPPRSGVNPLGEETAPERVRRGGSYLHTPRGLRSASRDSLEPDAYGPTLGLRLGRTLP